MSKRQPSRTAVRLMPPTTVSASRTVGATPALGEHVGGGEPGRAGADDDDVVVGLGLASGWSGVGVGSLRRDGSPDGAGADGLGRLQLRAPAVYGARVPEPGTVRQGPETPRNARTA